MELTCQARTLFFLCVHQFMAKLMDRLFRRFQLGDIDYGAANNPVAIHGPYLASRMDPSDISVGRHNAIFQMKFLFPFVQFPHISEKQFAVARMNVLKKRFPCNFFSPRKTPDLAGLLADPTLVAADLPGPQPDISRDRGHLKLIEGLRQSRFTFPSRLCG